MKVSFLTFLFLLLLVGCGTETGSGVIEPDPTNSVPDGGTTPGTVAGNITLTSSSFSTTILENFITPTTLLSNTVTSFKLCAVQIRLIGNSNNWIYSSGSKDLEISAGLVNLSNGEARAWGTFVLPTGFSLERVRIIVKRNSSLCGVEHSVEFNGVSTTSDVELKWRFQSPIVLRPGDALQLNLTSILRKIQEAASNSGFNGDSLKNAIESVEDRVSN